MAHLKAARIDALSKIPLFADLPRASLQRIAKLLDDFEAKPGDVLIQPGVPGSGLFLIEDGTVEVQLKRRRVELGPGEFVGELALLDSRAVRTARVRATTAVKGVVVNRLGFALMLQAEPKVAISMLGVLARRLADEARL